MIVGEDRGKASVDVRMVNRSAEVLSILQAERPEALAEVPERVQTLRKIDPSLFSDPAVARR